MTRFRKVATFGLAATLLFGSLTVSANELNSSDELEETSIAVSVPAEETKNLGDLSADELKAKATEVAPAKKAGEKTVVEKEGFEAKRYYRNYSKQANDKLSLYTQEETEEEYGKLVSIKVPAKSKATISVNTVSYRESTSDYENFEDSYSESYYGGNSIYIYDDLTSVPLLNSNDFYYGTSNVVYNMTEKEQTYYVWIQTDSYIDNVSEYDNEDEYYNPEKEEYETYTIHNKQGYKVQASLEVEDTIVATEDMKDTFNSKESLKLGINELKPEKSAYASSIDEYLLEVDGKTTKKSVVRGVTEGYFFKITVPAGKIYQLVPEVWDTKKVAKDIYEGNRYLTAGIITNEFNDGTLTIGLNEDEAKVYTPLYDKTLEKTKYIDCYLANNSSIDKDFYVRLYNHEEYAEAEGDDSTFEETDYVYLNSVRIIEMPPIESIKAEDISLTEGETSNASLTVIPSSASDKILDYTSSDASVATVDENGVVTGVKAGTATITVKANDGTEVTSSFKVIVEAKEKAVEKKEIDSNAGDKFAEYEGKAFYKNASGEIRCYDANNNIVEGFVGDGVYTYFFQADGTAMKDRLTYHPDGDHIIYFDSEGHEVFSNFANVKKTIAGEDVNDYCFFDVHGYMYVDVITYDKEGKNLYYANPYGVMEMGKWFQFSDTVKWADGTEAVGIAGGFGYANADGTLLTNTQTTDWEGRSCYLQGNGVAAY